MTSSDRSDSAVSVCLYGDPFCPCQDDGDQCHYRPYGESLALQPPESWWRPAPCGHPRDGELDGPVAWVGPDGPVCHCGILLDLGESTSFVLVDRAEWPLVPCSDCGCAVAVPREGET